MIFSRQNLNEGAVGAQNAEKFLRHGQGEQTGDESGAIISDGKSGRGCAQPQCVFIAAGGITHGFFRDVKTNQFVVSHCKPSTNRISILDHDTYAVVDSFDLPMPVLSIAYDEVGDRYVVGHKDGVHFSVLDSEFNVTATYEMVPEFTNNQDCDCDDQYIYLLEWDTAKLYASNVSVYDWEGNFVTSIVLKSMNEVESMFHYGDKIIFPFYTKAADIYEAELKIKK